MSALERNEQTYSAHHFIETKEKRMMERLGGSLDVFSLGRHSHTLTERPGGRYGAVPSSTSWQLSHGREVSFDRSTSASASSSSGGPCALPSLGVFARDAESRVQEGFAYCLDRGNGQLTRLIPADVLPPLNEVPAREAQTRGMVVLPPLRADAPKGGFEMNCPVTVKKHADCALLPASPSGSRKAKIYCDKWIHEGVCAFTQQGCKYKHEMPFDEATQHSLGLFQGFPAWWRKRLEDIARPHPDRDPGRGEAAKMREGGVKERWPEGFGFHSGTRGPPAQTGLSRHGLTGRRQVGSGGLVQLGTHCTAEQTIIRQWLMGQWEHDQEHRGQQFFTSTTSKPFEPGDQMTGCFVLES
ncbi:hypothetical protein ESCO_006169 [Escovopsis weberi]|uniref:C3H1-type domain-containing protein n=1 Tax=Escovopsis weberi TaxID=150374 RepID=A0A0M9VUS4_ESCWE|nr:hypothetical protein ESCO_006169 [Escovopsis weberi]